MNENIIERKKKKEKINYRNIIYQVIGTIIGAMIMGIGVALFLLPNQLSSGGVSGIATITYYLLNIPMGTAIMVINVPLFIMAIFKLGKIFFIKAILGTICLSIFIDFFSQFDSLTNDRFLACIYGGIVIGLGTAILLKSKSSTGGTDLSTYILKEYYPGIQMGQAIVVLDIIVISLNVFFFQQIEIGMYSAITIYIMGKIIDLVFEGVDFTKLLIIVSDKNEKIALEIKQSIKRGVTGLYGKGMHSEKDKLILMVAAPRSDVSKIKEAALKVDSKSFIIVTNSREVVGLGFKTKNE